MRYIASVLSGILAVSLLASVAWAADEGPSADAPKAAKTPSEVETAYPGLASGMLAHARLADLPGGILLRSGEVTITVEELTKAVEGAATSVRDQLKKNAFFLLEQMATQKLLVQAAKHASDGKKAADEGKLIQSYLKGVVAKVSVRDAEVRDFYKKNPDMFGGATFDQVKTYLRQYLVQEKQQAAVEEHIRSFGKRMPIQMSAAWVKKQAPLMRDNPVDKARASGRPTMVDFGRHGCGPCDMMTPILETLKKKHEGKANILFVHVGEKQILAARYGIRSIPVQVFFDKGGKEVFRHTGFFPQDEIEKKLAEMGVE